MQLQLCDRYRYRYKYRCRYRYRYRDRHRHRYRLQVTGDMWHVTFDSYRCRLRYRLRLPQSRLLLAARKAVWAAEEKGAQDVHSAATWL